MTQKNKSADEKLALALQNSKVNVKRQMIMAVMAVVATAVLCVSMTVAWYSNILHTSDLVFKAKSWDFKFEGNVKLADGSVIEVSPGQTGVVPLTVENISNKGNGYGEATDVEAIGVNVNISKKNMLPNMQQRMFFYVDKKMTINDEKVSRQYLSSEDGFMYTIYPGNQLKLSDDYYNDYRLYWYWVNDVVGYYFRGVVTDSVVTVDEYIRPVEYDYDQALFNENGKLVSVGGVIAKDFITEVLRTDGYSGNSINTKTVDGKVYYKISVDGNYGVWMYLCSESEIKDHIKKDTDMATESEKAEFGAQFILTGQQVQLNPVTVGSHETLKKALSGSNTLIEITDNMAISSSLAVSGDKILDLGGNTLTVDMSSGYGFTTSKGSLTVINGTVKSTNKNASFVKSVASEVYLDNVIVEGFYEGVAALDSDSTEDSHVFITNSKINTYDTAIWVKGNGSVSATKTTVIVENSILSSSEYIAIAGSGNDTAAGVDMQIMNSSVSGHYASVYHPMPNSSLYVFNSNLEGKVGIAVKVGNIRLVDCVIHGKGPKEAPNYEGSGFSTTGDGIYVEDNYVKQHGYELSILVDGSKTKVTSANSFAIQVYEPNSVYANVVVLAGEYSSDVSSFLPKDGSRTCVSNDSSMFIVNMKE